METKTEFKDGRLYVSRFYQAPRESVFEAWIETSKVQQWWGCAQTTAVRSEIEPCVGGKFNHHMTIEGAGEVPGSAVLTEFAPPAKLAFASAMPGNAEASMKVSVTFTEVDGGTLVELTHDGIPDIKVQGDIPMRDLVSGGWTTAFGKLAKLLATLVA